MTRPRRRGERSDTGFRLFPSRLGRRERRVYGSVLAFYLLATVGLVWPLYAAVGGIRPRVAGLPFSLVYVVLWVVASFLVLLLLYRWEGRRGDAAEGGGRRPAGPRRGGPEGAGPRPRDGGGRPERGPATGAGEEGGAGAENAPPGDAPPRRS